VVSQEEVLGEGEPLEVPCQVARVGHTLMGRPFQQMKEGHQAVVLEALRQEGPQFLEVQCCHPLLDSFSSPSSSLSSPGSYDSSPNLIFLFLVVSSYSSTS